MLGMYFLHMYIVSVLTGTSENVGNPVKHALISSPAFPHSLSLVPRPSFTATKTLWLTLLYMHMLDDSKNQI